jgi:hypothetical protein
MTSIMILGFIKFQVPISMADAPTMKNSIASSGDEIPPIPITGISIFS